MISEMEQNQIGEALELAPYSTFLDARARQAASEIGLKCGISPNFAPSNDRLSALFWHRTGKTFVTIFARRFETPFPFKNFTMLVGGSRGDGKQLVIHQAWRLYGITKYVRGKKVLDYPKAVTGHVERLHGTMRRWNSRMTRQTYCFSKKLSNHLRAGNLRVLL